MVEGPSWTAAETNANKLGGHLVTINDADEDKWLNENLNPDNEDLWIGISDKDINGVFKWSSGEEVLYTNWAPGEPNNVSNGYGKYWNAYEGKWDDASNNESNKGIAEIKLPQIMFQQVVFQ